MPILIESGGYEDLTLIIALFNSMSQCLGDLTVGPNRKDIGDYGNCYAPSECYP